MKKKQKKYNFKPVAMFFIVVGIIFFVLGILSLFLIKLQGISISLAFLSTIGGTIIMALGYINLELGMTRKELQK